MDQLSPEFDRSKYPNLRVRRRGAHVYFFWDGRKRGLGEKPLGKDRMLAVEMFYRVYSRWIPEADAGAERRKLDAFIVASDRDINRDTKSEFG